MKDNDRRQTTRHQTVGYPFGESVVRLRWPLILVSALLAGFAAYGLGFLTVNPDSRVLFDKDNPDRVALDALEDTYTKDRNVLIVLAPKNGDVFTREALAVVEELTEKAWQTPYSRRVDSITNFQHTYASDDGLVVEDLVESAARLTDDDLARVRDIALTRPDLVNRIVSETGDVTAVTITVLTPGKSLNEVPEVAAFARTLVDKVRAAHPEIDVYLTGGVMVDMAFAEAARADASTLVPLMLAVIILIVGASLRSVFGTVVTILIILMSVMTALGSAGWAGLVLNAATTAAPIIVMTLAVANCVHILAALYQQMEQGLEKRTAIIEALRVNVTPVAVTSLTTAIGFLTLNFSDSPPIRELGNVVATGMTAAFIYAIVFLPAMMAVLPLRVGARVRERATVVDRFATFVVARHRPLLLGITIVVAVLSSGIGRIVLDDDFIRYFDNRYEFRVDTDFTEDRLTGLHTVEFSLPAGEEEGVSNPDYLAKLDAFANWFRKRENVVHVSVLSDTIKRLNQHMNGDDPAYYRIPESRELAAQYLMLYELSMPMGLDLNSQINVAKSESRVIVTLVHVTSARIRELAAEGETWLQQNAPDMWSRATGASMVFARISERNIRSMLGGTILALVLISGILIVVLRSARIGIISLAPNLVPAAMAFGIWGYLFIEVNLAIAVVVAMTLGIVVDDTVHFLTKYLSARRERGMVSAEAVRFAFHHVGKALWVTSVALVAGFGVLAMSGFAVNGAMGLLSAITIAAALLADFLLLPPLLIQLDRRPS
ncbi:MAG: RND family transporter [Candidatus Methylomirabilia bacterium]